YLRRICKTEQLLQLDRHHRAAFGNIIELDSRSGRGRNMGRSKLIQQLLLFPAGHPFQQRKDILNSPSLRAVEKVKELREPLCSRSGQGREREVGPLLLREETFRKKHSRLILQRFRREREHLQGTVLFDMIQKRRPDIILSGPVRPAAEGKSTQQLLFPDNGFPGLLIPENGALFEYLPVEQTPQIGNSNLCPQKNPPFTTLPGIKGCCNEEKRWRQ